MNNEMLNQINILIQQEINSQLSIKNNELQQSMSTIKGLQACITKNGDWLTEKQTLLEKIDQLEQYSSVSLVKKYDTKVSQQSEVIKRLEKRNVMLKKQLSDLKKQLSDYKAHTVSHELVSVQVQAPEPTSELGTNQAPVTSPKPVHVASPKPYEDVDVDVDVDVDEEVEFHFIELNGTNYFLDSEANELYEAISNENVGELLGNIKKIKVRGNIYYRETINNTFHIINSDGNFEYAGKVVKGRAIFK